MAARSLSLAALVQAFYLNLYYITGISKAFEPFACTETNSGHSYLRADPTIECWTSDEHKKILALDIIPLLIYFVGVPVLYASILFYMCGCPTRTSEPCACVAAKGAAEL